MGYGHYLATHEGDDEEDYEEDDDEIDGWEEEIDDEWVNDRHTKASKCQRWDMATKLTPGPRSFACEKHSKWKKKCPANCPLRKENSGVTTPRRKLWTKKESAMLVQWADDVVLQRRETEEMWEDIARTLNRTVNSTKKKFMRYAAT